MDNFDYKELIDKIRNDENYKITLKEYQSLLLALKVDSFHTASVRGKVKNRERPIGQYYSGQVYAYEIARLLSEHIKEN